jgi:UDP:flavonoid glycosyltransferase YjiC (YdhE family)
VQAHQYLPQSLVLPHVDVVISQAGAGGTVGAIAHGLPHRVLPQGAHSQLRLAERIDHLGAGIRLAAGEQRPPRIREAAQRLLSDPSCGNCAQQLRTELERHLTAAEVVGLLERTRRSWPPNAATITR